MKTNEGSCALRRAGAVTEKKGAGAYWAREACERLLAARGALPMEGELEGDVFALRLPCGTLAMIDAEMMPMVSQVDWRLTERGVAGSLSGKVVLLHRLVAGPALDKVVLFWNHVFTDCRGENLRVIGWAEAMRMAERPCPQTYRGKPRGLRVRVKRSQGKRVEVAEGQVTVDGVRLRRSWSLPAEDDARMAKLREAAAWVIERRNGGAL